MNKKRDIAEQILTKLETECPNCLNKALKSEDTKPGLLFCETCGLRIRLSSWTENLRDTAILAIAILVLVILILLAEMAS